MKLLYIGNHSDSTGWSRAACDYTLALDTAGVDVAVRMVKYNPTTGEMAPRIQELANKQHEKYDVVIQQVLPPEFEFDSRLGLNCGLYFTESNSYEYSDWPEYANLLDLILVPNSQAKEAAIKSGVTKPIEIVPCAADTTKFQKRYKPLSLREEMGDSFAFYFISEFNERKNLSALVKAFHLEFDTWEKVELIIKSGAHSVGLQVQAMDDFLTHIKSGLRIYPRIEDYKQERVILGHLTEEDMMRLHAAGDVFVMPSHGEGWCAIPGTQVDTTNGPKSIESISNNDKVYSHLGVSRKVIRSLERDYKGQVVHIKVRGLSQKLTFTSKHEHYVVKRNEAKLNKDVIINPEFIPAQKIEKGDFWVVPKLKDKNKNKHKFLKISDFVDVEVDENNNIICPHSYLQNKEMSLNDIARILDTDFRYVSQVLHEKRFKGPKAQKIKRYLDENNILPKECVKIPNIIELNKEFMFFLGHYIAEGHCSGNSIRLATHTNEKYGREVSKKGIQSAFNLNCMEYKKNNLNCINLVFNNPIAAKLLCALCGIGAENKNIHNYLKNSENLNEVIRGFFYGDGHISKMGYRFTTISPKLANDIVEILNRENIFASKITSIRKNRNNKKCYTVQPIIGHSDRFYEAFNPVKYNETIKIVSSNRNSIIEDENNFYLNIRSVEKESYDGKVYNLSVEVDESYTCHGYATHNCIPAFDASGIGNPVIANGCMKDLGFLTNENAWLIPYRTEPAYGMRRGACPAMYTGRENWYSIDVNELRKAMREAFENRELSRTKGANGYNIAQRFSHVAVGNVMKSAIERYL